MNNKVISKIIEVGKFYLIHDGSKTGHPGLVIWKNDEYNLYLAIKIGTSSNKDNLMLKELVSKENICHYVYKRPFLGKRKDFGSKSFVDLTITDELSFYVESYFDIRPVESKSINRKDRYHFKRLIMQK